MLPLMENLIRFLRDERGDGAIEYALLAGLIACFLISGIQKLGSNLNSKVQAITKAVS